MSEKTVNFIAISRDWFSFLVQVLIKIHFLFLYFFRLCDFFPICFFYYDKVIRHRSIQESHKVSGRLFPFIVPLSSQPLR